MMKRGATIFLLLVTVLIGCKEDDINLFDKSADERAAEAIANLRNELTNNMWKVRYQPESTSGSFWVLFDFQSDGNVNIKSDLGSDGGKYFDQTITYRIDNSLGVELILESYCMFSFLFEQFAATFSAEYEFIYVNKTPNNELVFTSKTDLGEKTILLFQPATAADESLLGTTVATNLLTMSEDLSKFSSSLKMTYTSKDLEIYLSLDEITRNITFTATAKKSNPNTAQKLTAESAYLIQGDSIILDTPLSGNFQGYTINIKGLLLGAQGQSTFNGCANPLTLHNVSGKTSQNDNITLSTTISDLSGSFFAQESDFYFAPLVYIFNNGTSMGEQIQQDVEGSLEMHLYYNFDIGSPFYAIGLVIQNPDGSITFALRQFTPTLTGNNLKFNFAPTISIFGAPTQSNVNNLNTYLNALTSGDNTYVFKLADGIYEFHNPCTGWSFVFINAN